MKWEHETPFLPFLSKSLPNDIYKIYKKGSNVRVDLGVIGFN